MSTAWPPWRNGAASTRPTSSEADRPLPRSGFKTEANDLAREIRKELGLRLLDPLDPWRLADHLAIEVIPLSELVDDADGAVRYLLDVDPASFSAVTVFYGTERLIVHNDGHSPG